MGLFPEENTDLETAAAIITQHFVSQLLAEGEWKWAVHVALHLKEPFGRRALVQEIVGRFVPITTGILNDSTIFLSHDLKIPDEWVKKAAGWRYVESLRSIVDLSQHLIVLCRQCWI